ncbi:hypothetical protein GYH30_024043 [Glycine max]|uniref:Uncharacterized protein n=1 Tax=Glycine max TaxID=3847 RepID=A0A0R0I3S5_SOYBN|nr:hypothetical protein GYH30_024043 [Glycine max]
MQYSLWYFSIEDNPSSLHLSSQNFTRNPHPIFHFTHSLSHPPSSSEPHTKHKSLHHIYSLWFLLASSRFHHPPYFDSKTLSQRNDCWRGTSLSTTLGTLTKEKKKIGIELRIDFIKVTLSPKDKFLCFHSHL